jgi:uncharacterized protein (TIGR02246 family)
MNELLKIEKEGWHALSTNGDVAKTFYRSLLCEDAMMVFPGGMVLVGKEKILESFATQPWDTFQIENAQVLELSETASILVYQVTARRGKSEPYEALISSTYVYRDGSWMLAHHQQTPV